MPTGPALTANTIAGDDAGATKDTAEARAAEVKQ